MSSLLCESPVPPTDAPASPVEPWCRWMLGFLVVALSFHDKFADQMACSASAGNVSTQSVVENGISVSVASVELHGLDTAAFVLHACSGTMIERNLPLIYSEVSLSSVRTQPPYRSLGTRGCMVLHHRALHDSALHFMCATTGSTVVFGSVSPLILRILSWHLPVTA